MEEWRVIKDFPDYAVSDLGRVKRITRCNRTHIGKILKPCLLPNGYLRVTLCRNTVHSPHSIHRLVLDAFCPQNDKRLIANHKDGNKQNPRLENLEWMTPSENNYHALRTGLWIVPKGLEHKNSKLNDGEVWLIRRLIKHAIPQWKIALMFRVCQQTISNIRRGRTYCDDGLT